MANLVGSDIGLNYKGLINIGSLVNQNVSASLQFLTDGDGNNLPIQVSTTTTQLNYGVGIGVAPSPTIGLYVNGQAGTTGLAFTGAAATMYIGLNGTGTNFFDAAETRYRNFAGTTLAMNVWGNLGRVAIGGLATNYTPTASLQVRGDGTNPIARFEDNAGTLALQVQHAVSGIGLLTSGSWVGYNNSTTQLVGIQGGFYYILNSTVRFQINLTTNETRNLGNLFLGSIAVTSTARLHVRGDGTNPIARFENSAGVAILEVVNGGVTVNTTLGFYCNFLYPASGNTISLEGKANLVASTVARASLSIRTGVAPTAPVNGDIWFDGTDFKAQVGGVTKTFTLI